jgi:hypothetical protein
MIFMVQCEHLASHEKRIAALLADDENVDLLGGLIDVEKDTVPTE